MTTKTYCTYYIYIGSELSLISRESNQRDTNRIFFNKKLIKCMTASITHTYVHVFLDKTLFFSECCIFNALVCRIVYRNISVYTIHNTLCPECSYRSLVLRQNVKYATIVRQVLSKDEQSSLAVDFDPSKQTCTSSISFIEIE